MQFIKKNIILIFSILIIFGISFEKRTEVVQAFANLTTYTKTPAATSTPAYLIWGTASTTLTVPTNGNDTLEVSSIMTASSTATNFDYAFYTSSDNIDFYLLTALSTTTIPGVTADTFRAFSVTPTGAYTKIVASVGTSSSLTSRGALYLKAGTR